MNENNDIVAILDFNGDVIETISTDIFLSSKPLVKFISGIITIFLYIDILFIMLCGLSELRFMILAISVKSTLLFVLNRCLIADLEPPFNLKEDKIPIICRLLAAIMILSMTILVWYLFQHTIDFKSFKSQTIITKQVSEAIQLDDVTVKKIVGEDKPSYEYNICSNFHCGVYISEENVIADKYSVIRKITTIDYPEISSQDMYSYQLLFLDQRPVIDTFKSKEETFRRAYQTYQIDHMFVSLYLVITIILEDCILRVLLPYR